MLGLLREHDGVAAQVLMNLGLQLDAVRKEVLKLLGANVEAPSEPCVPATDVDQVVSAWPRLPEPLRNQILGMVRDAMRSQSGE